MGCDAARLVRDLVVGEAQRRQAGRRVGLIATPVARLLGGRAVVAQPVGLDDQAELRPEEVDSEAVEVSLRQRRGQTGAPGDRQEAPLELGLGEGEGVALEQAPERGRAALGPAAGERRAQSLRIDEVEPVRLVDESLELARGQAGGEVQHGADRTGDTDAVEGREVGLGERAAVEADAGAARASPVGTVTSIAPAPAPADARAPRPPARD